MKNFNFSVRRLLLPSALSIQSLRSIVLKKLALMSFMVILSYESQAIIRTVNNIPNSPGQYTTASLAIAASSAGDTIYLVGSPFSYGNFTVNTRLTIIGSGFYPQKQVPYATTVGVINITRTSTQDPSNSKIMGMMIATDIILAGLNSTTRLSGVEITRCDINTVSTYSNTVASVFVYHNFLNYFRNINAPSSPWTSSYYIYNNIIYGGSGSTLQSAISNSQYQVGTCDIYNNLITQSYGGCCASVSDCYNATFANNIFFGFNPSPYTGASRNNVYLNNLTYQTNNNNFYLSGTNTGSNNLVGVNPQFVIASPGYTYGWDYHLQPGSPALTGGLGGTQIGIYGGPSPFPYNGAGSYYTTPVAPIPQVYEMNMQTTLVPPTTTLNVQVKARKRD